MTEKELYTSPEVKVFSVRTEAAILTGSWDGQNKTETLDVDDTFIVF